MNAGASFAASMVSVLAALALLAGCGSKVASGGSGAGGGGGGDEASGTTTGDPGAGGSAGETTGVPGTGGSSPGTGGATPGTGGSTPGTGGSTPGQASEAIAMLFSEIPFDDDPTGTGSTSSSGSGPGIDPNTIVVWIADTPVACNDPFANQGCGSHWKVSFDIPPAMQKPGTYSLEELDGFASVTGPAEEDGECAGGGGSFWDGVVEITSIDDEQIEGKLSGTSVFEFDANGPFTALRCKPQ